MEDIWERIELAIGRINQISDDVWQLDNGDIAVNLKDYFDKCSLFVLYVYDLYNGLSIPEGYKTLNIKELENINFKLYEDILPENYDKSYGNPDFAVKMLGNEYGKLLSFLYTEVRGIIAYAYEDRMQEFIAVVELFLEIYNMFGEELPNPKHIKEAIYYHMYDYADVFGANRVKETIDSSYKFATNIIMESDLNDMRYLYSYGEYIGSNEIKLAEYLNNMSEDKVKAMAKTYVDGFINGFETMRIDIRPKKTVNIRYAIGQERMVRYAIELFRQKGLEPVIFRYPVSRFNRRKTIRQGFVSTPVNKQFDYDHRMDEAVFLDKALLERKLEVMESTYEQNKQAAIEYAGPAVIETFGEVPFAPLAKDTTIKLTEKQQSLSVWFSSKSAEITNKYIPQDKYSFTIIAYPMPEIGEDFEAIFDEVVKVNTLDNEVYKKIQQSIIDCLDNASYVHILGKEGNLTDIKVMLHDINKETETNFENCLADVNIPLGEVFTSPKLTGTEGVINVKQVYLNELKYENLLINIKNGMVSGYTCDNFDKDEENKAFIKDNLLFNHHSLPIGEFAIGTNTVAYVMAKKYDIVYKLPILIVEKMGPHFALGDTCYSYSEESKLYNPDGKEIVAKENECSILRKSEDKEEREKAYFNCHTDITIPYEEIGGIYAVLHDGSKTAIIENGRFVLPGTKMLNDAFEEASFATKMCTLS